MIKNKCIKYLHFKNHRNILSVGILLPSVQLWLNLNFYCSFITKLLVDTIRMITGMDVAYHFFITPVMKVSVLQLWTTREMDSCLVIATKCWFSRGFLPTQGWNRQKVSGNCCEKHLKAIIPGSRLSTLISHWRKGVCSLFHLPLTSDEKWRPAAEKVNFLHSFCTEDFILVAQPSHA